MMSSKCIPLCIGLLLYTTFVYCDASVFPRELKKYQVIKVLDQLTVFEQGAANKCGFHAFKNAISLLEFMADRKETLDLDGHPLAISFIDPAYYFGLNSYIYHVFGNMPTTQDASVVELNQALEIYENNTHHFDVTQFIVIFHFLVPSKMDTSESIAEQIVKNGIFTGGGELGNQHIYRLLNIKEKFGKKNESFQFAFIIGIGRENGDGHWVTLMLDQDVNGHLKFKGMDSLHNQINYHEALRALECIFTNHDVDLTKFLM